MAAQLTLYCARPISHVTSKDVLTGIDFANFYRLVEKWHIADADLALAHLRINTVAGKAKTFLIRFGPAELPVVPVTLNSDPDDVAEWREAALRSLPASNDPAVELVRERLPRTVECVSIRLGWETVDAGFALGWAAGEFLARTGDALLFDEYDNWWLMRGKTSVHLFQVP